MRRLMALALTLVLAGCTVGPDYARPAIDVPQAFDNADRDARQAANIAWWNAVVRAEMHRAHGRRTSACAWDPGG